MRIVRVNGGADSGALKRGGESSCLVRGLTGSTSALLPVVSVSVTGSGEGQMSGQYVVEIATRMRCPAAKEYAQSISGTRTLYCRSRVRRVTFSGPFRCVRLRTP